VPKLAVGSPQLHLQLRLNQVLPRLPLLDIRWFNLSRPQDSLVIMGAEDGAMVGDDHLGASLLREGRTQELEHRGEILVGRRHPRHNLARVLLQHADTLDLPCLQFDQVADSNKPH